jgi:hypothetical protein
MITLNKSIFFLALLFSLSISCKPRSFNSGTRSQSDGNAPEKIPASLQSVLDGYEGDDLTEFFKSLREDWRAKAVLAHSPRGTHEGSPMLPRIVVPNLDASLVLSFSPLAKKKNAQSPTVEVMVEEEENFGTYKFYTIVQKDGKLSASHQTSCTSCRAHSFPIWDTYSFWPSFYGVTGNRTMNEEDAANDPELSKFDAFRNAADLPDMYKAIPFLIGNKKGSIHPISRLVSFNNVSLGHLWNDRLVLKIALSITRHSTWQQRKKAYLAAHRGDVEYWLSFVPKGEHEELRELFKKEFATIQASLEEYERDRIKRAADGLGLSVTSVKDERDVEYVLGGEAPKTLNMLSAVRAMMTKDGIPLGQWSAAVMGDRLLPSKGLPVPIALEDGKTGINCLSRYFGAAWNQPLQNEPLCWILGNDVVGLDGASIETLLSQEDP